MLRTARVGVLELQAACRAGGQYHAADAVPHTPAGTEHGGTTSPAAEDYLLTMASLQVDRYDEEEIRECLSLVAYHRSPTRARRAFMEKHGYAPSVPTITGWRDKHLGIWHECQEQLKRDIMPRVADQAEGQLVAMLDANQTMLEQLMEGLESGEIPVRELPAAIQKLAVAAGQTNEKIVSPARGRPTVIVEHKEPTELLERLSSALAAIPGYVDSTAEEEPLLEESNDG